MKASALDAATRRRFKFSCLAILIFITKLPIGAFGCKLANYAEFRCLSAEHAFKIYDALRFLYQELTRRSK
jgi:hypothetical protein